MDIDQTINDADELALKSAIKRFLGEFTRPAFGSLPKREIELIVFQLLREIGALREDATLYDLMTDLRITRAKASGLVFDSEVRKFGDDTTQLDNQIIGALINTKFAKDGDFFILEVQNPLLNAHLKDRLQRLNHISDTSFNSSIVRMPLSAVTDLIESLVEAERLEQVRLALIAAGAPDTSLKGVLLSATKKLGSKVLGNVADGLVDDASAYLSPIFRGAIGGIGEQWSAVFEDNDDG